jgi:hypothetical protein
MEDDERSRKDRIAEAQRILAAHPATVLAAAVEAHVAERYRPSSPAGR